MHLSSHRWAVPAALLVLILVIPATAVAAATPSPVANTGVATFTWSAPVHFGTARDKLNRIVESRPDQVTKGPWRIDLQVIGGACVNGGRYHWTVDGKAVHPERASVCSFSYEFPHEGEYEVHLVARAGGRRLAWTETVTVQDFLIVSLGDSVASGEAVPDVPDPGQATWQSARCHRSARAAPAKAAKAIEDDDGQTSVTFVHLACSGATVPAGLVGPYGGVESSENEPPLEAQVRVLKRIAAVRPVDAVLVSIGANDVHFGEVVRFCASHGDCFSRPFPEDESAETAGEVVAASLADLPERFEQLKRSFGRRIPADRVYLTEYFDPTRDENGETCDGILAGVSSAELDEAQSRLLVPLNEAIATAAGDHHWHEVTGIAPAFRKHGYCAGNESWVTTLGESVTSLGGTLKGRFLGTLHPNEPGQQAIGNRIAAALEKDLYPGRTFAARPDPVARESDGGSSWFDDVGSWLGDAWATLRLPILLLVGIVVAGLILAWPRWRPREDDPFRRLARTLRPLTLPLFVVVAVGSIRFGVLGVVLVSALATLVAWRVVIGPSLTESKLAERWEGELPRIITRHIVAVAAGFVVLLLVAVPIVNGTSYFETIGNVSSALILLSILLWVAAIALRLTSYANSSLRALIAAVAAILLVRLGMAVGVLPGEPDRHSGLAPEVWILAGVLAVLLVVEIVVSALRGPASGFRGWLLRLRRGGVSETGASRAGALGFTVVAFASLALLLSTGYGLIEAAERGGPLQPPEEAAVEAGAPTPRPVALEGRGALVHEYAPVLAFTKKERWTPIRVEPYLENARLISADGAGPRGLTLAGIDQRCPAGQRSCYTLTIDCESGEEDCAHGEVKERDSERLYREGAVYVRVLRKADRPGLFIDRGPFRSELETLVQYWYFYYYDEWQAPVFAGLLTQLHEGDWEVVSVGLDETRRPLFVADSAHCAGTWRYWDEVERSKLLPPPYVHPLVAVAQGSHANYPDPNQKRTPDPASCAHAPAGVATALSYASNIRDRTEYGWAWYPPPGGWLPAAANKPPMSFPGTWGATDRIILRNFNSHQIGGDGHGPLSPPLQGSWSKPVATIFCGSYKPPPQRRGRPVPDCAGGAGGE
ncbi:MAG TPA: GDSL-type esterase/lipase family protein [Solirubrobacterales bacterium]|nr:GDSL-type esterase/lipase family protein [Solirubrobacterales bacterium]